MKVWINQTHNIVWNYNEQSKWTHLLFDGVLWNSSWGNGGPWRGAWMILK